MQAEAIDRLIPEAAPLRSQRQPKAGEAPGRLVDGAGLARRHYAVSVHGQHMQRRLREKIGHTFRPLAVSAMPLATTEGSHTSVSTSTARLATGHRSDMLTCLQSVTCLRSPTWMATPSLDAGEFANLGHPESRRLKVSAQCGEHPPHISLPQETQLDVA